MANFFFSYHAISFAAVVIAPRTVIDHSQTFHAAQLDLTHGSFIITNNATLTISDSDLQSAISPANPFLIKILAGHLILKNSNIFINASTLQPQPNLLSLYNAISIFNGNAEITNNHFTIDTPYTVGLLMTNDDITQHLLIDGNTIYNFHGGILLKNTQFSRIINNKFYRISNSNVFILGGHDNLIENNQILFPGNNNVGDGVDIINATNIQLNHNFIGLGSCYSVVVMGSKNILISNNKITSGITYAIAVQPNMGFLLPSVQRLLQSFGKSAIKSNEKNRHIVIRHNYLSQNRYGLSATSVDGLIVTDNFFIQHFNDAKSRKFWTNNQTLLHSINELIWEDNFYKEAYGQETEANPALADQVVNFPSQGGVDL